MTKFLVWVQSKSKKPHEKGFPLFDRMACGYECVINGKWVTKGNKKRENTC